MELLKEIKDKELSKDESTLEIREASRAIVFDEAGLIPLLFVTKHNYHKLPGGGIEVGEDRLSALARETKEETGCEIEVTGEVGQIEEYRSRFNLKQTSYCYLGKIVSKGEPDFTPKELQDGFQVLWVSISEAISKIENDKPDNFIQERDLAFLKKAQQIIQK